MKEIRLTEKQIAKFAEYIKENIEDAEIDCDGYFNLDEIALFKNGEEDAYSPTQSDFNVICRMVEC